VTGSILDMKEHAEHVPWEKTGRKFC
jgi:hypothetical protein